MMMMSWTNTSSFVEGNVFMWADLLHTCLNSTFSSAVLEFIVKSSYLFLKRFVDRLPLTPSDLLSPHFPPRSLRSSDQSLMVVSSGRRRLRGYQLSQLSQSVEQNCPSAVIPSTAQGLRLFFRLVNLNCFYQMNFYWGCFFLTLLNFIFTSARVNVWFLSSALLTLVSFALVWQHFVQLTLF